MRALINMEEKSEEFVLEWIRTARNSHNTFAVALPRQLARKWNIGSGSRLSLQLKTDGSLVVKPSPEEREYQRRIKEVNNRD